MYEIINFSGRILNKKKTLFIADLGFILRNIRIRINRGLLYEHGIVIDKV